MSNDSFILKQLLDQNGSKIFRVDVFPHVDEGPVTLVGVRSNVNEKGDVTVFNFKDRCEYEFSLLQVAKANFRKFRIEV
jgi:hypothetical protein